jgi:hypothetical protein
LIHRPTFVERNHLLGPRRQQMRGLGRIGHEGVFSPVDDEDVEVSAGGSAPVVDFFGSAKVWSIAYTVADRSPNDELSSR